MGTLKLDGKVKLVTAADAVSVFASVVSGQGEPKGGIPFAGLWLTAFYFWDYALPDKGGWPFWQSPVVPNNPVDGSFSLATPPEHLYTPQYGIDQVYVALQASFFPIFNSFFPVLYRSEASQLGYL